MSRIELDCKNCNLLLLLRSREIREQLKQTVAEMKEAVPDFSPGLTIVQVGNREDSNVYIRSKIKAATEIGMKAELLKLPSSITEIEVN